MTQIRKLNLPDTYEDLIQELKHDFAKMSQFVVPVEEAERKLTVVARTLGNMGKIVLILGIPGSGKSTFIRSLTWRKHLQIPRTIELDASNFFGKDEKQLNLLYQEIQKKANELIKEQEPNTVATIVINYLENLAGQDEQDIRAFFRNINGLLRKYPLLIIWPATERDEAERLLQYASAVSGTVFSDEPVLEFKGPPLKEFPRIAKDTISVLNPGLSFDDFLLNDDELNSLLQRLQRQHESKQTIRNYLKSVRAEWQEKTGELRRIIESIPKPTEIWFVVCYPEAEIVVSQFARKSPYAPDDTWDADYRRLSEYIIDNTRNAAEWNDPKRLQLALRGVFRTKIMFIPTNAIVSCVAAYGSQNSVQSDLIKKIWDNTIENWRKPVIAKRFLLSSPMVRQLKGDLPKLGNRRSGTSAQSIKESRDLFESINKYVRDVSDQPINRCLAQALREIFNVSQETVTSEQKHPFLPSIRPDITVKLSEQKIVCIEMFYTANAMPSELANYILNKLDNYMRQLDYFTTKPFQPKLLGDEW